MLRILRLLTLPLGLLVVAWLVWREGPAELLAVIGRIGWGFGAILAVRAATIVIDSAAWYWLLPRRERVSVPTLLPLRWIGEAVNCTLPAAQIGGEVVRARLLSRRLAAPGRATASVTIDFCFSLSAQILFTGLGLLFLAERGGAMGWWPPAVAAIVLSGFTVAVWQLVMRRRAIGPAQRWARRLRMPRLAERLDSVAEALELVAAGRGALAASLFCHLAAWAFHTFETWLTLWLMGASVGPADAVMLESLSMAARSAAFLIPSGWGAQEAALIALVAATGLSGETALALGLVKRARELAIGLPALALWTRLEHRQPRPARL